jgi:hypothetical protein
MDKRKYQTKTLICEYEYLSSLEDCKYSEKAYALKDGSKIIEYNGNGLSLYGVTIGFGKHIARKGVYSISDYDFEMWKSIRSDREDSLFIDWEKQYNAQMLEDYETVYKCIGENELPF